MSFILQPWQFFFIGLAGWISREQQRTIEYLITENQVLREKVGNKRILLNDDQRRRLAVKGRLLDRKLLASGDHRKSRYYPPLASTAGGSEVGLQRPSEEDGASPHQ